MKKQLTALALSALLFAAAASGCNQTETNTSAQQDPDPAALASALLEGGSFDDQLSETDQQAAMTVLGLDPEQVDRMHRLHGHRRHAGRSGRDPRHRCQRRQRGGPGPGRPPAAAGIGLRQLCTGRSAQNSKSGGRGKRGAPWYCV